VSHNGLILANEGFHAPGPVDFFLPDFTGHSWNEGGYNVLLTKASVLLLLGGVLAYLFLAMTSRKAAVVPSKAQYLGEQAYNFVRNGVAQDVIGKGYQRFVPLLVSLFFFVLINNLFGIVPVLSFAPFSKFSFAVGLAALVWIIYNAVGIADKGFVGYLKHSTVPSGVPSWILPLLIPLEFLSNIIIRPATLSLRLFANMFAGHMLLLVFTLGGFAMINANAFFAPFSLVSWVMTIALTFLEFLVIVLQAYVFTVLTASYVQGALADGH
jgi:F-type H+-transporting ATPase subunit a